MTLTLVIRVLELIANVLEWIVLLDVIVSWVPPVRNSIVGNFLAVLADPILRPIRALINRSPLGRSPLDFSPIFAYLLINLAYRLLASFLIAVWPSAF